ncbi:MAG TPA: arylsulfotransferase family protein [Gemmatimonadales bacterium]|nr:arylsulfotransferase family protein [Gemmatimonadales bacterium]
MRLSLPRLAPVAALLVAASLACDSEDSTKPSMPPRFVGASVAANSNNAISATVTLTAVGYDSVHVRFWHDSAPPQRTPSYPFLADSTLTVPVLGLDTASAYSLEVVLERKGKQPRPVDTLAFASGSLPAWVPTIGTVGTDTLPGYLLLSLPNGPVIIDNLGKVVWYRFRPGGVLGSWTGQPDGSYTWLSAADSSGYYVHNVLGEETGRLACVGYKTRFHDVLVQASGDVWIMCDEETIEDLTAYGGIDTARVTSTVVQHLDPSGQLVFQWRSIDHLSFDESDPSLLTGLAVNFTHGNAIEMDADGLPLVSFRSLDEIVKIDTATGNIVWRFGGPSSQFTIVNDTKGAFQRQHGLRVIGQDHLQFLDNGTQIPSRLVRYTLDTVAMTATLDWEFIDSPTTFSAVGGATQVLSNGGALVTFGPAGRVVEVDGDGNRAWELSGINGTYVFRAQRLTSLYYPASGPEHR